MSRNVLFGIIGALVLALIAFAVFGESNKGPFEEAGETLDDAADDIGDSLEDAADDIDDNTL